jgi:hypothetical protein
VVARPGAADGHLGEAIGSSPLPLRWPLEPARTNLVVPSLLLDANPGWGLGRGDARRTPGTVASLSPALAPPFTRTPDVSLSLP